MGMLLKLGMVVLVGVLTLTSSAMAAITLTWEYALNGGDAPHTADGFKVYRAMKVCSAALVGDFTMVATVTSVNTHEYVDNAIPSGTSVVCYYITAYNIAGSSPESNRVQKSGPSKMAKPQFK